MTPRSALSTVPTLAYLRLHIIVVLALGLALAGCVRASGHLAQPGGRPEPVAAAVNSAAVPLPPPPETRGLRQLSFSGGVPIIPIRLMEGQRSVTVHGGPVRVRWNGQDGTPQQVDLDAATLGIRVLESTPARTRAHVVLAEFAGHDRAGLERALAGFRSAGLAVETQGLGERFGLSGRILDNRRRRVVLGGGPWPREEAGQRQADTLAATGYRSALVEVVDTPSAARLELSGTGPAAVQARGDVVIENRGETPLQLKQVEFGVGYDFHGHDDRAYRGDLTLTPDTRGLLAVVNQVGLEELLLGLVPAEIFASAHPEALKAQAVTARGEVLAKLGLKHDIDPYWLCSEQHCAVYKGIKAEVASTSAAVAATRGQVLVGADGALVDTVYSAVCGGHTEDNESVWGGTPNPALRGKPDLLATERLPPPPGPAQLPEFLQEKRRFACAVASVASPLRFRWEKRFTAREMDERLASLGVGRIHALSPQARGASGRIHVMNVSGESGATQIKGELALRKLLGMLNSALFDITVQRDARGQPLSWLLRGGGWGHGVGMCQVGAIGRAEAGESWRDILHHYFTGAEPTQLY